MEKILQVVLALGGGFVVIYIVFRMISYAITKSYYQAKHEYNNNNKEISNGKKKQEK